MRKLTKRCRATPFFLGRLGVALVALTGFFLPSIVHGKIHLKISASSAVIEAFENWTSGNSWDQITNFKNANANRPVVDLVLQLQALKAGGLDFDFELERSLISSLAKKEIFEGQVDLTAETVWDNEIEERILLKSDTVIRDGEFAKGVYTLPSNQKMLKVTSLEELRGFNACVIGTWALDVKTLEAMKLKGVVKGAAPEIVFTNIQKGLGDFALWEFSSNPEMSVTIAGVKLVPVTGCKVAIRGSRSWAVSKTSPNAAAIHAALQAGTKILRDNGTIERAFRESGFFNPRVVDWKQF